MGHCMLLLTLLLLVFWCLSRPQWAKQGCNVWHERWGEDYEGSIYGGACTKWTDKVGGGCSSSLVSLFTVCAYV